MSKKSSAAIAILFFCGFASVVYWLQAQPSALGMHRMTGYFVGCEDKATINQMLKVIREGDRDASLALANTSVAAGNCVRLNKGDEIQVEDVTFDGLTQMRVPGNPTSYWTVSKLVD